MPTDWDVVRTMERFGGSFVRKLGELCHLADPDNLQRIKTAWPDYWQKYSDMFELAKERDGES